MKRIRNLSLIILFTFLIIGCKQEKKRTSINDEVTIYVQPQQNIKIKLTDIIDDINIVPLQTSDSSLMDEIFRIKKVENKFYIKASKNVFVFDNDGRFERKLAKNGKGPNEILAVTNFYVNDQNNTIEIYDGVNSKNIIYDHKGNVIQSTKHEFRHGYDFIKGSKEGYFFYIGFGVDKLGELIYVRNLEKKGHVNLLPYNETLANYLHSGDLVNFAQNKYGTYFTRSFSNVIYQLKGDSISPKYHIDFGNNNLPDDILFRNYRDIREFMMTCSETDYAFRIVGFYEMENLIIFGFHYKKKIWNALYNKNEQKCNVISYYLDDYFGTGMEIESSFALLPKGFNNSEVFLPIEAYKINEIISECKKSNDIKMKKVLEVIESKGLSNLKDTDNPVILEIKLK